MILPDRTSEGVAGIESVSPPELCEVGGADSGVGGADSGFGGAAAAACGPAG